MMNSILQFRCSFLILQRELELIELSEEKYSQKMYALQERKRDNFFVVVSRLTAGGKIKETDQSRKERACYGRDASGRNWIILSELCM